MKWTMRKYQHDAVESDYWRIRQFLREKFPSDGCQAACWPLYRWDYWRWHINANIYRYNLGAAIFIWEVNGEIGAVLHPDGPGEAFLHVRPDLRSPELEVELMSVAETQFAVTQSGGAQRLAIWSLEGDFLRQDILQRRGYLPQPGTESLRRRDLRQPVADAPLAPGYTFRALGDRDELPARSWLSWKAFHATEPDERYAGWEWYLNVQRAPLYRRDLDLLAVAPDGELAAFCTVWFDDVTRSAAFEPVGTHPDHRRRGLGRAILTEGLRRSRHMGAIMALVSSYGAEAGALYQSAGFHEYDRCQPWQKTW